MPTTAYAFVFAKPSRERLPAAAQLVARLPAFAGEAQGELDLHHHAKTGYTAAVVRAAPEAFTPDVLARMGFWSARAGARGFLVDALPQQDRVWFDAELARCDRSLTRTALARAQETAAAFFGAVGVTEPLASGARPVLAVDLDGPGAEGMTYRPEERSLFIPGVLAPPCGDPVALSVRDRSAPAPVDGWATVVEVRARRDAAPGHPAGFTLRVEGPGALHELLARHAPAQPRRDVRAAPRYPVKAPVKLTPAAPVSPPSVAQVPQPVPLAAGAEPPAPAAACPQSPPPLPAAAVSPPPLPAAPAGGAGVSPSASSAAPRARLEYASDEELAADWIDNLSHGGAFVRTASPHPEGTELAFELALPDGARLDARAVVAFVNAKGMGLRFVLSPEQDQVLSMAIARLSARPRRALVVDDDALARTTIADALAARGFEVLTAVDGAAGLRKLTEELLALDLFVTDIVMPGLGGESLIHTIRKVGGEAELAIVAMSSYLDPGLERTLERAGADAVLDKSLGAELLAQAADAVLERKRLVQQADAA
jgi:uncharacterized protein (TIGR02266 family)